MHTLEISGRSVPALGFGTAGLVGDAAVEGVKDAIDIGYRHIDTAQMYRNEAEVGKGIASSGVPRDEIFLTTKIVGPSLARDRVGPATEASLKALGTEYIDLLLIHAPSQDVPVEDTLEAMVAQQEAGKIRHIGVSNFRLPLLEQAQKVTTIFANQVPYQVGRTQRTLCEKAKADNFMLTAYSPLRGRTTDPAVAEIAEAHGKTPQQVALRWLLQQPNVAPIPRSSSPSHRRSNFEVFDFELSADEMAKIHAVAAKS